LAIGEGRGLLLMGKAGKRLDDIQGVGKTKRKGTVK
jgi:hypothetical protein